MFTQPSLIFLSITLIGFVLWFLGFKYIEKTGRFLHTSGVLLFCIGLFGFLYNKIAMGFFISLLALVAGIFFTIDPLHLKSFLKPRLCRLLGYLALLIAVAFSLDYFCGLPVWLWIIPIGLYALPYLITPFEKQKWIFHTGMWIAILLYLGVLGYAFYGKFNPQVNTSFIQKILPQLKFDSDNDHVVINLSRPAVVPSPKQNTPINPTTPQDLPTPPQTLTPTLSLPHLPLAPNTNIVPKNETALATPVESIIMPIPTPLEPVDPYVSSLKKADDEFTNLKNKYQELLDENKKLKEELTRTHP